MSTIFKRGNAQIEANLTPMIDVTFLLIVFFVLVSQIVEAEHVTMDLPEPDDPASVASSAESRAVVNVTPAPGGGDVLSYKLGARTFEPTRQGLDALSTRLRQMYETNRDLQVNLRADRRTHYRHVQAAMDAISRAASSAAGEPIRPRINLAVIHKQ